MSKSTDLPEENLTLLYKGGRLPGWYQLSQNKRQVYEQAHVDLMLSVAKEAQLKRLEGFRLITPQQHWERFWLIEFATLSNAEAWIKAEMAPPYGDYGYYEYDLDRGDAGRQDQLRAVARVHNLMRLEAFELIGSKDEWHRVWVAEFPTLAGAEAWINALVSPPHGSYKSQRFQLARKWAPAYFASWAPK